MVAKGRINRVLIFSLFTVFVVLGISASVFVAFFNPKNSDNNVCSLSSAPNKINADRNAKTKISRDEVYTYKIPSRLDFTKVLTSNFEKDRPKTNYGDDTGKIIKIDNLEYDSFKNDLYDVSIRLNAKTKKLIAHPSMKMKKVTDLTELEKITIYSSKTRKTLFQKPIKCSSRVDEALSYCMDFYKETGKVPQDLWDFSFFQDLILKECRANWKRDLNSLFNTDPVAAWYISPITGEFFSFNNPTYKKGQLYICAITDPKYVEDTYLDVNDKNGLLVMNKNCWVLYYRVYGEDNNTIIKEDFHLQVDQKSFE